MKSGKIIIISAPSGSGKSTIINQIIGNEKLKLKFSLSATNRSPRVGEEDGVSYHFLTTEQFQDAIKENKFVEFEEVYPGRYYGTLKSEVQKILDGGNNLILDIDVKGGINVKKLYPDALALFIMPPSIEALKERLINRNTDNEETINQRISKAEYEISFAKEYDKIVVNDDLSVAVEETTKVLTEFINS